MGLTGTKSHRLSKKSIQAHKSVPTFLGLIGRTYEFQHDNFGRTEPRLNQSRNQRRRQNTKSRKIINNYSFCEFGTRIPISSLKSRGPSSQIYSLDSKSNSKSDPELIQEMGDRPLNVNLKQDRQRLRRIKRNLEALQKMAQSRRSKGLADPFKLYKEIPGAGVDLFTKETHSIPAGGEIHIPLSPKNPRDLRDKVWLAYPASDKVSGVNFKNHDSLQVISTIIDKNVSRRPTICVQNISTEPFLLKSGTRLCNAKEAYYSTLPIMDSNLVKEIEEYDDVDLEVDNEENLSPKAKAEKEFQEDIVNYNDNPRLKKLLEDQKRTFIPSHDYLLDKIDLPPVKLGTKDRIITPTPPPARRHFTEKHDEAISAHLEIGLMNGLIQRQQSSTVSPMHAVEQNGKIRVVMDSRKVNEQLSLYNYIFPKISEEIEELASGKFTVFSQTDATGAFNQIEIHPESRSLLAFAVYTKKYRGTFSYARLPFGIKSAPAIFASVLDRILENINDSSGGRFLIKSFIDDIFIAAVDMDAMIDALKRLFARLNRFNVKLSLKKSKFAISKASFCGIEINKDGYCISEKRKKLLKEYPDFDVRCRKKNNDLSLLGFYNWHRRFVKDYTLHDRKIRETIKSYRDKEISAEKANSEIKAITDYMKEQIAGQMLVTPSSEDTVVLQCDASGKAWGYICYRESDEKVIAYGGGAFTQTTINSHNIFEKETLAMSNSLSDVYKLVSQGKQLIIKNDNLSLIKVNKTNKTIVTQRMIKYLSNIVVLSNQLPTNFIHLNTHENYLADVLSRLEYNDDGSLCVNSLNALDHSEVNLSPTDYYEYVDGKKSIIESEILCTEENQYMSMTNTPRVQSAGDKDLLEYYRKLHSNFHWSVPKTLKSLKMYGIPVKEELVTEAWLECPFCQEFKRAAPLSKLKFRETPERPFDELHLDHIIKKNENQSSFGHVAGFTAKCSLTRYFFCYPVKDVKIRTVVTELRNLFMSVGRIPKRIYADNAFDTATMHEFCKKENISIAFRASNLSRSVSVESTHRRLHEKISSMLGRKSPSNWHEVAWRAAMALNSQPNDNTGFSPYYLFYGKHPDLLGSHQVPTNVQFDNHWLYDLKIAKERSDSNRKARSDNYTYPIFQVGHCIYIRPDNSKNASSLRGTVVTDNGGATLIVQLDNRARPLPVHKGMVFTKKYSDAWKLLNGTNRDFHEMVPEVTFESPESDEPPVAYNTRSKARVQV